MGMRSVADRLMAEALEIADGAAINYRYHDQAEESARTFEIIVKGKPMKVKIVVESL
jgi:hypothetical protein